MMTAEARTTVHAPWCTDHHAHDDGSYDWCSHTVQVGPVAVEITNDNAERRSYLSVTGDTDNALTPAQAREVSEALLEAAYVVEEDMAQPVDVEALRAGNIRDVEALAKERGVSIPAIARIIERGWDVGKG